MTTSLLHSLKTFFGFDESEPINEDMQTSSKQVTQVQKIQPLINQKNPNKPIQLFEIKVEEPRIYEDSLNIAAQLRNNTPVIINLKYLEKESSKRLIDFICGTAYAINGHMMKIGENIFLFTPAQVNIINADTSSNINSSVTKEEEKPLLFKKVSGE
ncbi:MAG: cell division protein SepF [bacterium]